MSSNEKNIPKRRFKEFIESEEWEERKLGDACQITMGQSPYGTTYSEEPSDYILIQGNADLKEGWVEPRIWTTQKTKTADAGDLIMSVRAPAGAMGKTAYNAVIGRGVAAIKGNEFIYQTLVRMDENGYWKRLSCGSTFESLNSDNIRNAVILVPNSNEQEQIGSFFNQLDNFITLHQRKLDKLKVLKKAYLAQMFPSVGESKPRLRFSGFNDDWEQRKLGELCDVYDGTHQTPNYRDGGIMFLSVENINTLKSQKYISEEDFIKEFNIFPEKGDVLMTRIGDIGTANVVESNEPKAYYVSLALLKKKLLNPYFLKESISSKTVRNDIWKRTLHIAFPKKINKNEITEVMILYPQQIDEQEQIGIFFKNFDNLITLHQRKLEKLQNLKKAYLNEMFV